MGYCPPLHAPLPSGYAYDWKPLPGQKYAMGQHSHRPVPVCNIASSWWRFDEASRTSDRLAEMSAPGVDANIIIASTSLQHALHALIDV